MNYQEYTAVFSVYIPFVCVFATWTLAIIGDYMSAIAAVGVLVVSLSVPGNYVPSFIIQSTLQQQPAAGSVGAFKSIEANKSFFASQGGVIATTGARFKVANIEGSIPVVGENMEVAGAFNKIGVPISKICVTGRNLCWDIALSN